MRRALACNAYAALAALVFAGSCATGGNAISRLGEVPPRASFDRKLVERGAGLAAIGDCRGCHTPPGGRSFAGGRALETPFGTIYTSNITPDARTGIGLWSEEAFRRAMREGVDRGGHHLYPAFPYDRFTLASDADIHAIYAYLMTRPAVSHRPPANRLSFPFNVRAFLGVWKALYLHPGPYRRDPARDARWNRGAELVEGLGHCASCHSPRNALGAERADRHLEGGDAEGWHAYAVDARSRSPVPWTEEALATYLWRGWHPDHGVSRGPMASVTRELAQAQPSDLAAMSGYIVSLMRGREPLAAHASGVASNVAAAALYRDACAQCHDGTRALPFGGIVLSRSIGLAGESPRNLVNVILYGLPASGRATSPIMPGFAGAMSDMQVVALAAWLRARFTGEPPWGDLERAVREARAAGPAIANEVAGGEGEEPARTVEAR